MIINKNNYDYKNINLDVSNSLFKETLSFDKLIEQLEVEKLEMDALEEHYLFNKLVSLCIKKGKKKMAYKHVVNAFLLLKQFFRFNPIYFLKIAVLQIEPFVFLHKIPMGNKEVIYPRILPIRTRIHNSLNIVVKQAFNNRLNYKKLSISLAYSILENSISENIYQKKVKENIEIAELNKRNIKHKKRGQKIIPQIKRRDRFKLFKKIKNWK
jgi:ribosomal protein S7